MQHTTSILLYGGDGAEASRLRKTLARHFGLVESATDLPMAQDLLSRCRFNALAVIDPTDPWDTIQRRLSAANGPKPTLVILDRAHPETAIEAMRNGVSDVLLRPFDVNQLVSALRRLCDRDAARVRSGPGERGRALVGASPGIEKVRRLVEHIAPASATVLIQGETGSGKELVARLLHDQSGRSGSFVPLNCSAVAPDLMESELFGHTKGAFTNAHSVREGLFVSARRGTLFLDEISEMPLDMQVKLLRALEENAIRPVGSDREVPIDCRIIASTQERLEDLVDRRRFREDLYYRLNVLRVALPPLRDRREDIPLLVDHFMDTVSAQLGVPSATLAPGVLDDLTAHAWPGNVRELRNVVERTLLLGRLPSDSLRAPTRPAAAADYPLDWTLEQVKRHHMTRVLDDTGGNKSAAARRLNISRRTLERKLGANK